MSWKDQFGKIDLLFAKTSNGHYEYAHAFLISGENGFFENKPPWYLFL